MARNLNGQLLSKQLGRRIVIRYTPSGFQVNPEGTGTRELSPGLEQLIIDQLAFTAKSPLPRYPQVPEVLAQAGVPVIYQGF